MSSGRWHVLRLAILLLVGLTVASTAGPQRTKRYAADGLSFDYPAPWPLRDESDENAQHLILDLGRDEAEIVVLAFRAPLTPEKAEEIRKFVGPTLTQEITKKLQALGGDVRETAATATIGGVRAEGVSLRTVLAGEAGTADVYWLTLGGRPVYLVFLGSDDARARAAGAWSLVCESLHVDGGT